MGEGGPPVHLEVYTLSHEGEVHAGDDVRGTTVLNHDSVVLLGGTENGHHLHPPSTVLLGYLVQFLGKGVHTTSIIPQHDRKNSVYVIM